MFKKLVKKNSKGFTLIELLVVIAIIGILATIVLVSLNSARQKARDVKRVGDMRQMQVVLESYYDDVRAYPAGDGDDATCVMDFVDVGLVGDLTPSYVPGLPADPGSNNYFYDQAIADDQNYVLVATLEDTTHSALAGDVDTANVFGCVCTDPAFCLQP
ncbi:MAG: hypothetical protein A2827_03380 [Candidatus Spechtbacteria bacterium RIFCSPHIGHO2_01_FULL_43_30]|uniref:Type II secretion system protein GspG C-terminal domain-containing protein n=1 Tax=Candidatus Spechtbacteria bacterium RIFCSPHIGHO2_01_FULL_43_30 TaxID=1802158 RepID=A0A1G2H9P1_9BACT|nr:MAG: hypothetical protein A2827_03380 [Candidatus Spechtbacteria bacterium RIFCSPHIGHO2_01_FULL_43_30]